MYLLLAIIFGVLILMAIGKVFMPYIFSSNIKEHIRVPIFINVLFSYAFWKALKKTFQQEYKIASDNRILSKQKFKLKSIIRVKKNDFIWVKLKDVKDMSGVFGFANSIMKSKAKFVIAAILSLGIWIFGGFYLLDKTVFVEEASIVAADNSEIKDELQKQVDEFISKADKFAAENDYENAIKTYYDLFEKIDKSNDDGVVFSMLGELMVKSNNGIVSAEAQRQFDKAMRLLKFDERSVYYTAISRMQAKKYEQAIGIWKYLISRVDESSKWHNISKYRIENIADYTGINKDKVKELDPTKSMIIMRIPN